MEKENGFFVLTRLFEACVAEDGFFSYHSDQRQSVHYTQNLTFLLVGKLPLSLLLHSPPLQIP